MKLNRREQLILGAVFALIVIGIVAVAVFIRGSSTPSDEEASEPPVSIVVDEVEPDPVGPDEVVDETCPTDYPELIERVTTFESAWASRDANSTTESLMAELRPLMTDSLFELVQPGIGGSIADEALSSGETIARVLDPTCSIELVVTPDGASAVVRTPVSIVRTQDGERVVDLVLTKESRWILAEGVWLAELIEVA